MKPTLTLPKYFGKFLMLSFLLFWNSPMIPAYTLESEEFEARFRKLSNELRCPTCQGLSVKDSEAGFSNSIKDKVRELLKEGKTDDEIKAYFVKRYGEWILREPSKEGFNLLLWVMPVLLIVMGLGWVILRSRKWVEVDAQKETSELTADEERKVMGDLERFENS